MALKADAFAGISAAAFNAVGAGPFGYGTADSFGQLLINATATGIVGGILHELQGGKFGHGFLASGASAFAKPAIRNVFGTAPAGKPYRIAARAAIGGTLSSATGGKFVNGAVTAAFSQAFNEERTLNRTNEIEVTWTEHGILYETADGSVLVQNNQLDAPIPKVGIRAILDALAVSVQEGRRLQIISGSREDSSAHKEHGAIDVFIEGYTTEETAAALHKIGRFNRVSSYTGRLQPRDYDRLNTAHADYKTAENQGLFEDWVHQRN